MPLTITLRNHLRTLVTSDTAGTTTEAFELQGKRSYTIYCSPPLGASETAKLQIYNHVTDTFHDMKMNGSLVQMTQNYDVLVITDTSAIVQIVKSATASATSIFVID